MATDSCSMVIAFLCSCYSYSLTSYYLLMRVSYSNCYFYSMKQAKMDSTADSNDFVSEDGTPHSEAEKGIPFDIGT